MSSLNCQWKRQTGKDSKFDYFSKNKKGVDWQAIYLFGEFTFDRPRFYKITK